MKMANHRHGRDDNGKDTDNKTSVDDLLLHPELLSQDFIRMILHERNIETDSDVSEDHLTGLYMRHVIPLPQRELPKSRWGQKMQKTRGRQTSHSQNYSSMGESGRKRPLIVFDGSSTGSVKLKKSEASLPPGTADRLKPPPSMNLTNPIRKLSGSSSSSSSSSPSVTAKSPSGNSNSASAPLKRPGEADNSGELKSPEVKKKIQHVTWP